MKMSSTTGNPIHFGGNDINTRGIVQPAYTQIAHVDSQPVYSVEDGGNHSNHDSNKYIPPTGEWRDGIFDCYKNFWPSFGCVACGGVCIQFFYASQISTRIKYIKLIPLVGIFFVGIIVLALIQVVTIVALTANIQDPQEEERRQAQAAKLTSASYYYPEIIVLLFVLALRFKFIEYFRIPENPLQTCLYGIFCFQCSLCQMGRHMYGYTQLFDGDGRLDGNIEYPPPKTENAQALRAQDNNTTVIAFSV